MKTLTRQAILIPLAVASLAAAGCAMGADAGTAPPPGAAAASHPSTAVAPKMRAHGAGARRARADVAAAIPGSLGGVFSPAPSIMRATPPSDPPLLPALGPGATRWAVTAGSPDYDIAMGVAVDSSASSIVVGGFSDTFDAGCGPMTATGTYDMYVAKYASGTGTCTWAAHFAGTADTYPVAVAVDSSDVAYVTGSFSGAADFGGGPLVSAGGEDGFIVALTSSGAFLWARRVGGAGDDYPFAIAVSGGKVAIAGAFDQTASFGGADFTSAGDYDAFVARYEAVGGAHAWSNAVGGAGYDGANGVAFAGSDLVVAGTFAYDVDFGFGTVSSAGDQDGFLVRYAIDGTARWADAFGGTGGDEAYGVSTDAAGAAYVAGSFQSSAAFGGASPLVGAGACSGFVARYDGAGAFGWGWPIDADQVYGLGVAVDSAGSVWVTGAFSGTLAGQGAVSEGAQDAFLSRYDVNGGGWSSWTRTYGGTGTSWGMALAATTTDVVTVGGFDTTIDLGGGAVPTRGSSDVFTVSASIR